MIYEGRSVFSWRTRYHYVIIGVWDGFQKYALLDTDTWKCYPGQPQSVDSLVHMLNCRDHQFGGPF